MSDKDRWTYELTPEDAREALAVASEIRAKIGLLSEMIDGRGRNVRWEVQTDISRTGSLIGDTLPTGRVLLALAWELERDFIDPYAHHPEIEAKRRRSLWVKRLVGLGVTPLEADAEILAAGGAS